MILRRVEINLYGPDGYVLTEAAETAFEEAGKVAVAGFLGELKFFQRAVNLSLPEGFEVEVLNGPE